MSPLPCVSTPLAQAPRGVLRAATYHILPISPPFFQVAQAPRGRGCSGLSHVTKGALAQGRGGGAWHPFPWLRLRPSLHHHGPTVHSLPSVLWVYVQHVQMFARPGATPSVPPFSVFKQSPTVETPSNLAPTKRPMTEAQRTAVVRLMTSVWLLPAHTISPSPHPPA